VTRFAWLQSRTQTFVVAVVVAALAVAAAITGVQMAHLYSSLLAHCTSGCDFAVNDFTSRDQFFEHLLDVVAQITPALIGIFWGAPLLAREYETGTYRLAWTQSVSRSRWLLTRLALGALVTIAVASVLTLTVTWWFRAVDHVEANQYGVFDRRSVVPVAYALFAFALGALAGAVLRRTVPAMAVTLAVFVFVRVGIALWVRPNLFSPRHEFVPLTFAGQFGFESHNGAEAAITAKAGGPMNAWTLSEHMVTSNGHVATFAERVAFVQQHCAILSAPPKPSGPGIAPAPPGIEAAARTCTALAQHTFHIVVTYQPASRYWAFQWIEGGIFALLALLAASACYWWVVRRND
jgi:hypothetical protein